MLAIEMATRKRDQASQDAAQVKSGYLFAQDQMTQLQTYAAETEARWTTAAQISTTPELMRHHYQFMGRLDQAVVLQQGVLEGESRRLAFAQRLVLEAEFRLVSLKQVLKKKQADMAVLQSRRDQKQMDEFAALQTRRTKDEHLSGERA